MDTPADLSKLSMMELFRVEVENQSVTLTAGLLELERGKPTPVLFDSLMRAVHSIKGGARIVDAADAALIAHVMEDCFATARQGKIVLDHDAIDTLLRGVDMLAAIARAAETVSSSTASVSPDVQNYVQRVARFLSGDKKLADSAVAKTAASASPTFESTAPPPALRQDANDRVLRLAAENLNRLLGLAGESLVESRWLRPFGESMQRLKRMHSTLEESLDGLREALDGDDLSEQSQARLGEVFNRVAETRIYLGDRLQELDLFDRRSAHLSNRLYLEVLRARMRPFGDGVRQFPRMVRDLARSMGKQVRFEVVGEHTQVDRDILDRMEAPLAHLLRNAIDHGCETPAERAANGKRPEATIRVEARHSAGALVIIVSDDGAGVNLERVRETVARRNLATADLANTMSEAELLEFLFLPGFTLAEQVTEISGRGVGLDVVQNLARSVRGGVRVSTQLGRGTKFQLQLPLTLSVVRTLLVEIGGEPFAIPLAQIAGALKLPRNKIETLEGRHHFRHFSSHVGLLSAHQVLEFGESSPPMSDLPVVVLGDHTAYYGLMVDRFLGERELVVQPLDPRLGKVKDISAAALMEDGSPVLIVDVDDILRSIEKLIASGTPTTVNHQPLQPPAKKCKRVLAVDDSLTVRELERKLLAKRGYEADVAVDGMDGWNAVRNGDYDLVITDVDMPRMDGIELTGLIKSDQNLKCIPVLIVSYKDREEDRMRGLEAGADYYLTKGSFHDETLLKAVADLIGEAES
jgi:two-component system sensor histidine kinase and response regulator WspE